jgi:capsular polysaccharide biosynthesis protein
MEQRDQYDEISLRELIEALLRQKKLIALITATVVLLAGIYSFLIIEPTYESKMILMASSLNLRYRTNDTNINIGSDKVEENRVINAYLDALTEVPTMNAETYKQQIATHEVMAKTIEDLGLQEDITPEQLIEKISLETIKDTQLITISMTYSNPNEAAAIVNKVGENFIEFVNNSVKERAAASSEYIVGQMEKEKRIYDSLLNEQKELLSMPRGSDEVSLEMDALMEQLTEFKTQTNELEIRKSAITASIAVAESIPSGGSSLTLNQNTGRVLLDSTEKQLKMELAGVESELATLQTMIPELEKSLEGLRVEFQEKYHDESILIQKVQLAKDTYEAFVKKYEEVRVAESTQIGEASVTIVSNAYPSVNPVGPRKMLNMAIGLVLGLMVGVFAAFFIEYWKQSGELKKA